MKSYNAVLNKHKKAVLEQKQYIINEQKNRVLEALKLDNFYNGKITDLPKDQQDKYLKNLLEYWKPKTGLTKAGERYLKNGMTELNENSDSYDVKKYILKHVTLFEEDYLSAFKNGEARQIVEALQSDIESRISKKLSYASTFNVVYNAIEDKFKCAMMK